MKFHKIKIMAAIISATPFFCFSAEIVCPESITETPVVSNVTSSWVVHVNTGNRPVEHVGIYFGDPDLRGAQIPDMSHKKGDEELVTWKFTRSKSDEYWAGCSYLGTTTMLFQKLDSEATQCVAKYNLLKTGRRLSLQSLVCR
jgi:hypothetical protein